MFFWGIPFDNESSNYEYVFAFPGTNIGRYLENVFLPELLQFNQSIKNTNTNLNTHELLKKVHEQQEYIKLLEQKNLEYKKLLDEVSIRTQGISNSIDSSDIAKLTKTYTE